MCLYTVQIALGWSAKLMYFTTIISSIFSFSFREVCPTVPPPRGRQRGPLQLSLVFTRTDDRILPILWKSGVTNKSVRLLHTTCTDGSSIMKLWSSGITSLREEEVQSQLRKNSGRSGITLCSFHEFVCYFTS